MSEIELLHQTLGNQSYNIWLLKLKSLLSTLHSGRSLYKKGFSASCCRIKDPGPMSPARLNHIAFLVNRNSRYSLASTSASLLAL